MPNSFKLQERGVLLWLVGAILLLAIAVRVHRITVPVIWYDEAFSVLLSRMPPGQIVFHAVRDVHPPLYYLILHYWMQWFGEGALAVRSLSLTCGAASVWVAIWLTRQASSWRAALVAGVLLALLPLAVRYSQEARMYALLGLLLLTATGLLLRWARTLDRRYLFGYAVLITASLYTHYFTLWCVMANWSYVLLARSASGQRLYRIHAWWLCNLAIALAYLPWLPSLLVQVEHRGSLDWIPDVGLLSVPMALWQAFSWGEGDNWAYAITTTLVLIAASIKVTLQDTTLAKPGLLLLAYTVVPIVGAWLISFAMPLFMVRYLVFAMLGIAPLMAIALNDLHSYWRALTIAACLGLETMGLVLMHADRSRLNGSDEWVDNRLDGVMSRVNVQWRPGDAMLVDGITWYYTVELLNHTGQVPFILMTKEQGDNSGRAANTYGGATLLYPRSEQLYVADPLTKDWRAQRIWWIASGPVSAIEMQLLQGWTRLGEIQEGRSRALLFKAPVHPSIETGHVQAACGSKLSARAICHMRE